LSVIFDADSWPAENLSAVHKRERQTDRNHSYIGILHDERRPTPVRTKEKEKQRNKHRIRSMVVLCSIVFLEHNMTHDMCRHELQVEHRCIVRYYYSVKHMNKQVSFVFILTQFSRRSCQSLIKCMNIEQCVIGLDFQASSNKRTNAYIYTYDDKRENEYDNEE
jgi:hypothetical protein